MTRRVIAAALLPLLFFILVQTCTVEVNPWRVEWFNNPAFQGPPALQWAKQIRLRKKKRAAVSEVSPKRHSSRWTVCLRAPSPTAILQLVADDTARLLIDEREVLKTTQSGLSSVGKRFDFNTERPSKVVVEHTQQDGWSIVALNVSWDGSVPVPIEQHLLSAPVGPDARCH